jgi:hypothetical protein
MVLVLSKRRPDLCAAQLTVHAAGFRVAAATNLNAALGVIRATRLKAIVVCTDSWPEEEFQQVLTSLITECSELPVVTRCPGCVGCDERSGQPGELRSALPELLLSKKDMQG